MNYLPINNRQVVRQGSRSVTGRRKKSHRGVISKHQRFAISEIETYSTYTFEGSTRYEASIFISFFLDPLTKTIYPHGIPTKDIPKTSDLTKVTRKMQGKIELIYCETKLLAKNNSLSFLPPK